MPEQMRCCYAASVQAENGPLLWFCFVKVTKQLKRIKATSVRKVKENSLHTLFFHMLIVQFENH